MNEIQQKLASLSPERRRLFEQKLRDRGMTVPDASALARRKDAGAALPLSSAQQRMWFMQQLDPASVAFNMNLVLRLKGPLDRNALERAFAMLGERHEPLRTRFLLSPDGQPSQIVGDAVTTDIRYRDCRGEADPEGLVREEVEALVGTSYDLSRPPLRVVLLQVADEEHILALGMHHIVSDRWSMGIFARELSALYEAEATGTQVDLPALDIQFPDWAAWQRGMLEGAQAQEQLAYWTERLSGELPVLELPFDRARGTAARSGGAHLPVAIDRDLALRLRQLAVRQNVSLFTLLLSAFKVFLHLYTDSDDIVVGSEVTNRDSLDTQKMIGPLVNTLVFRTDLSGYPAFETLLQEVNRGIRGGLAHQDVPFERLVEALNPDRSLAELNPLFQVKFDLQHSIAPPPGLHKLAIEDYPVQEIATKYELRFNLVDDQPDITGKIEYSSDLFDESTIADLAGHFHWLLEQIAENPARSLSTLSLLSPGEVTRMISAGTGPERDYPTGLCLHDLVRDQAARTPDAPAVTDGKVTLNYRALSDRTAEIAAALNGAGVRRGHRVGICVHRSAEMIPALLGIMKAGAAYVPLDPGYPADRLAYIASDAGLDIILSDHTPSFVSETPVRFLNLADLPDAVVTRREAPSPEDLAYVIYTSGSTGRPKGVAVEHRAVVALLHWARERFTREELACMLVPTSISFDLSIFELYAPIAWGGTLAIADTFLSLPEVSEKTAITFINTVPSLLQELLQHHRLPDTVRAATFCGEPLPAALVEKLKTDYPALRIVNLYGPSEDTVFSTEVGLDGDGYSGGVVPIGTPLPDTRAHVLDRIGRLRPAGMSGELYLSGTGVTRGYFGKPGQTAERFLPDPFSLDAGARLYKTGDRVKRRADGVLEFLGRFDHQVKVRGLRIEIGEIEHHLEAHPDVAKAVVTVTGSAGHADRQLAAFIEPEKQGAPDEALLRRALSQKLPAHMVPTLWTFVSRLPQQPNGKIDRKALPALIATAATEKSPPQTALERIVADAWSQILDVADIGVDDNFFKLGGHSLLAMRMIARLPQELASRDVLRKLFEFPRLKDFAAALVDGSAPADLSFAAGAAQITPVDRDGPLPLSSAQKRLWTLAQLEPESAFYNIPAAVRFHGKLDTDLLLEALKSLCARHEILRSRIRSRGGQPEIEILPQVELDFGLRSSDESTLLEDLKEDCLRPFDLERAPLFRTRVYSLGPEEHVVLFVIHHVISDARSLQVAMMDVTHFYDALSRESLAVPLPPLTLQYADYAAWQQEQPFNGDIDYWRNHLADAPPLLDLPTDFPRGAKQDFAGAGVRFSLNADLAGRLRQFALEQDATPFMVVLSAFNVLLSRYSGSTRTVIGTPVSDRPHPDLEKAIGLFVNTLALNLDCRVQDSFASHVQKIRDTVLAGFAHQQAPFEQVVDALAVPRNWSHNPVFQAMFTWQTEEARSDGAPDGLVRETVRLPQLTSKVDISLDVHHHADGLSCAFIYRTDLFLPETIENMAEAFVALLEALVREPGVPMTRISFLPETQRRMLLSWNDTTKDYPETPSCLHAFFERAAAATPNATAVTGRSGSITYVELDRRATTLTRYLTSLGISAGDCVGICMRRDIDLVCAMLAVLKTGAAYVPLDPNYPDERIAFIAANADLALLLTGEDREQFGALQKLDPASVWNNAGGQRPDAEMAAQEPSASTVDGRQLAYVIYTSGSTGTPKGVAIEHRNAAAFINWSLETFSTGQLSGMLAATSVCFDLSIFEIFATLAAGGCVFVVEDLFELPDAPFRDRITCINTVPTPMTELLRFGPLPEKAATVCLAGEPLSPSLATEILKTGTVETLYNLYGPSEDTTYSTGCLVPPPGEPVHIGQPIANTQAYVLDEDMQEVPVGLPGELYLAGQGLARGYLNRPDLTAERFLPNPFSTRGDAPVMYRTGDRVRRLVDGNLEYVGRCDRQMKISGFRIEPGEVETVLLSHPLVSGVVVDAWTDQTGYTRLAAWVEAVDPLDRDDLTRYLDDRLPQHLVPALFRLMERLPRLPNGKLDRKALPAPAAAADAGTDKEAPREGFEHRLALIWSSLLGREDIGREDNFFSLGGDSILAIQVVARARQDGIAISPRDLFLHSSLAALAAAVTDLNSAATNRGPVTGEVALTPAQHWFFEQAFADPAHWNQSVLLQPVAPLDPVLLQDALNRLAHDHDALRARFSESAGTWRQTYVEPGKAPALWVVPCTAGNAENTIAEAVSALHQSFDIAAGPVWGAVLIDIDRQDQRLAIAAHHLVVDGVSWRILLDDLRGCLAARSVGREPEQLQRSSAAGDWVTEQTESGEFDAELGYWTRVCGEETGPLPADHPSGSNLAADSDVVECVIDAETTRRLLQDVPSTYPVKADEVLLAALALAAEDWAGRDRLRIILEGHGRHDIGGAVDLSRTVGWFTSLYPVLFDTEDATDAQSALLSVKETLRAIPNGGTGFGVLKHLRGKQLPRLEDIAGIRFNYLGQTDNLFAGNSIFRLAPESAGEAHGAHNARGVLLDVNCLVTDGRLQIRWSYSRCRHEHGTVDALSEAFRRHLTELIDVCLTTEYPGYTPADFPHMDFDQKDLTNILQNL